jgi:hypothetical protein
MKYVLVNDRTPFRQVSCVQCRKPIGMGYLRNIGTRLCYCNVRCHVLHCAGAEARPEKLAQSS